MSTHIYREPFPCDTGCEHMPTPCPGNHAVVVTWHNTSAITSIHVEPGRSEDGLWLDTGGASALRRALARDDGDALASARDEVVRAAKVVTTRLRVAVVAGLPMTPDVMALVEADAALAKLEGK